MRAFVQALAMKFLSRTVALFLLANTAFAVDISVVGLFPNKAVLVVDGKSPKTYAVGSSVADGITLLSVDQSSATIDMNGKRQSITLGAHVNRNEPLGTASASFKADERGHFMVQGQINGGSVRMLVDTGATLLALPAADAARLGIDYRRGQVGYLNTANGVVAAYRVQLDSVKVGDIELNQVDAVVQESGLPMILLGMSFLNRTAMRRDGESMTLTKRF
jgi:aspartyl protease family protein